MKILGIFIVLILAVLIEWYLLARYEDIWDKWVDKFTEFAKRGRK